MEIKRTVKLKTSDAKFLLDKTINSKRGLFKDVLFKVALIYNQASAKQVYPYIHLLTIKIEIDKTIDQLQKAIKKTKKVLKRKANSPLRMKFPTQHKVQFGFSNPIVFGLIEILKLFDTFVCLINCAKNIHAFNHQDSFYRFRNRHRKNICTLLSKILLIPTQNLPIVTIENYLTNHQNYINAARQLGEIKPQMLYNAVCASVTPSMAPREIEQLEIRLKARIKAKQAY